MKQPNSPYDRLKRKLRAKRKRQMQRKYHAPRTEWRYLEDGPLSRAAEREDGR